MKYKSHQHLKLSDLNLHPEQLLHIISMLQNHQSYPNIQRYIKRNFHRQMLTSTISNLKHKVITARSLKIPLTYLLDERRKPHKARPKVTKGADRLTVLDCINGLIRSYYADVESQTLTDKQRSAFIQLIKIKLKYDKQIKDEVIDPYTVQNALEESEAMNSTYTQIICDLIKASPKDNKTLLKQAEAKITKGYQNYISYNSEDDLEAMQNYCKRHNINWTK